MQQKYYKEISLDCMSDDDVQSFLYFKWVIEGLINKYNPPFKINVVPAVVLKNDAIAFTIGYNPFVIGYNVEMMSKDKDSIMSDAIHEFLHVWFNTYSYIERMSIIDCICREVISTLSNDITLQTKYSLYMSYMYNMLVEYSFTNDIICGEEVLCELASHLKSPVKDKVFNIIINKCVIKEDLDTLSSDLTLL